MTWKRIRMLCPVSLPPSLTHLWMRRGQAPRSGARRTFSSYKAAKRSTVTVLSCNSTTWSSWVAQWEHIREVLPADQWPHYVALQEHHLAHSSIADAQHAMATLPSRGKGTRAGVAAGARPWIGQRPLPLTLHKLRGRVCAINGTGCNTCGDFQRELEVLRHWGVPQCLGGVIRAPAEPTCITARSASTIDAFIVATELEPLITAVRSLECVTTRPHVPILLHLSTTQGTAPVWTRRIKKQFPGQLPIGPVNFV
eukprot:3066121-Amphidinium_carterae.3